MGLVYRSNEEMSKKYEILHFLRYKSPGNYISEDSIVGILNFIAPFGIILA